MSATRRDFLGTTALGGRHRRRRRVARAAGRMAGSSRRPAPLRILILGGTGFIGPHQVRHAVARGHKVTLFNRGRTNPGLFKDVSGIEERIGDRAPTPGNYEALKSGEWDVVIDNPTTRPRWVREAAAAVRGRAGALRVHLDDLGLRQERHPGRRRDRGGRHDDDARGRERPRVPAALRPVEGAGRDRRRRRRFPAATTVIRPGLIVGVGDATDRFTYWPVRISRGGEVLAPPADDPVQIIDARDLAEWTIRCCEHKVYGVFNATGPASRFTVEADARRHPQRDWRHGRRRPRDERVPRGPGPAGAWLVRPAGVGGPRRRVRRLHPAQHRQGAGQGTRLPALRRHGQGDARLLRATDRGAQGAAARRTARRS